MRIDRRLSTLVLAGSVLLNVFLLGALGERVFAERREEGRGGQAMRIVPLVSRRNVKALPAVDRKSFRDVMRDHHAAIRAARGTFRDKQATAATDISAERFDRDKIAADLEAIRTASLSLQGAHHAALLDALARLPRSARSTLVGEPVASGAGDGR